METSRPRMERMATYRIDELARTAGTTVRNVRAFQERGVLPPPQRHGRTGVYDDSHLARIRLVVQLQERGYTFAVIAELISAWERGHDLGELLGLEKVLTDPWTDEIPGYVTLVELGELFLPGETAPPPERVAELLRRAEELGFVEPAGDRYRVPSPRLLNVGAELVAAGIPLEAVFDIAARLAGDCREIARRFVRLTVEHADLDDVAGYHDRTDLPDLAQLITRLRPLAQSAVHGLLARGMQAEVMTAFGERIEDLALREEPDAG
ncbi:MerD: mercuric resistance transcriptional repressor protein MerD [Actinomadura rubteroloni]|uniref:MerD: mercuric resistance transcriptional repressor protein MerD n=1 Tax=Actinomadura rubteroloni TaxID=1926885 RepID=A0A2P4UD65_9ACTN|nr:MerR family transcriptional regulator [Actinomadura rubteroloni]POM22990.1 MerD: mercuric resistance transcriptional repressor protein MerD [Actinomadura rubteroloni]